MTYHPTWSALAKKHFEQIISAHGGWSAWQNFQSLRFEFKKFEGFLLFSKGLHRSFETPSEIFVNPKAREVQMVYPTHTDSFQNGKLIFSTEKKVVADGRTLFTKSTFERWKPEHALYFFGYSVANYMSYPFILPQFELIEYDDKASCFQIKFPKDFHTHCQIQDFYFNQQHLLSRHDYHAEYAGPFVYGAHFTEGYEPCHGIQISCIRKVRAKIGPLVLPIYGIYSEFMLKGD